MSDHIEAFRTAMTAAGLVCNDPIKDDGKLHRFRNGDAKDPSAWYVLFPPDPIAAGKFGDWRGMDGVNWKHENGHGMDPKTLNEAKRRWAEAEKQRAVDEKERHDRMSMQAVEFIRTAGQASPSHLYFASKKVGVHGPIKQVEDDLVLPLQDATGKVWSYQTIDSLGDKLFKSGARVSGLFYPIADKIEGPLVICEGYATGATIHEVMGWAVVCAMNCGNLLPVAKALRDKYPTRLIIIAADNDRFTKKNNEPHNPGVEKATATAAAIKATLVIPQFPAENRGSDFNDLAETSTALVRLQFEDVIGAGLGQRVGIKDLLKFKPDEDATSVLGTRFLCKGGSCVLVGQTSIGKSSLSLQMAILFALGYDFFGLRPVRPLKSVYVQAENDMGDLAEMIQGVLLGLGIIGDDAEENRAVVALLEKNLIIIRDQTHVGASFPPYARKLIEIHQPDLFWLDPLLSFYGDDVNDQKEMSNFLRSGLNPISEATGVIWFLLHHTGKPSKDAAKSQKSWTARDFAYMGIGSSELSNWARAIITVVNSSEDEFRVIFAKRGWRSGVKDDAGNPTTELNLAHGGEHICWKRIPKPKDKEDQEFHPVIPHITQAMSTRDIIRIAAKVLQRGERTMWKFWDSGNGPLGVLFESSGPGRWLPKQPASLPHPND